MTTALDSSLTAACFLRTNHNALISKATNEFASFCIDNRLRQMAIFTSLAKWGKDPLNSFSIKTNEILYDLSLYYVKQIDIALRLFSHRSPKTSKCGKNITDTLDYRLVCHFFVLTTF